MAFDITLDAAELAIVPTGTKPASGDWVTATWTRVAPVQPLTSDDRLSTDYWFAKVTGTVNGETDSAWLRVLVGPTGTIAIGSSVTKVDIYSRVHDTPEVPVQRHGSVSIV